MVWWLFRKKDDHSELKNEIRGSFFNVKQDIKKIVDWINHLHNADKSHEMTVSNLNGRLSSMEDELSQIKTFISFFDTRVSKQLFNQRQTTVDKQTAVEGVQTPVQTAVQTAFLGHLSVMERAIVWVLLNTDLKLSHEDVAAILNKEKSTIRGQLNSIKQKSNGLIEEIVEKNGKKRFYVPINVREMLLSQLKPRKSLKKVKSED